MTFGGSREGVGIFYVYTFAYTYAGSRLKSLVFIGWFESSTGTTKENNSLCGCFFFAQKKEPTAKTVGKFARLIADYSFTTRATSFAKAFLP